MIRDPRIGLAFCAHVLVIGSAIWLIGSATAPASVRIVVAVLSAATLLPWLHALARRKLERLTWMALLLVLIIGIGIVEVLASGAQWHANILLGSAMLEFVVLISLSRGRTEREPSEPTQR